MKKLNVILLTIILLISFNSVSYAENNVPNTVAVRLNTANITEYSEYKAIASTQPTGTEYLTDITVDGDLQQGDQAVIFYQSFSQWQAESRNSLGSIVINYGDILPELYDVEDIKPFAAWVELRTSEVDSQCRSISIVVIGGSNGTATIDGLFCGDDSDPPDDPPDDPPG